MKGLSTEILSFKHSDTFESDRGEFNTCTGTAGINWNDHEQTESGHCLGKAFESTPVGLLCLSVITKRWAPRCTIQWMFVRVFTIDICMKLLNTLYF